MKLSLFQLVDLYPESESTVGALYQDVLAHCALADELGFDSFWIAEHHGASFGRVPNPAVLLAAAAGRTQRIRLGPAVSVLPFRHPLVVAEDYAMVDQLSGGRLLFGVGSGNSPREYEGFGLAVDGRRERFEDSLAAIEATFGGAAGGHELNLPPHEPSGPPIFVATNTCERARVAAEAGHGLLTLVLPATTSVADIGERLAAHAAGLEAAGREAESIVVIMGHVAETDERARELFGPAITRFAETHGGDAGLYDAMVETGTGAFGSVDSVAACLTELARVGAGNVDLWMSAGAADPEAVAASIRIAATDVLPVLPEA